MPHGVESAQYNMQINVKKTKTMVVTWNEGIQAKLEHEGEYLDQVKDFKFWGSYKSVVRNRSTFQTSYFRTNDY